MGQKLLIIFFILFSINAFAGGIKGSIVDSKNSSPLTGAIIAVKGTDKGTVTDFDGNFELNGIPSGTYEISISYTSYVTQSKTIIINGNEPLLLEIKLDQVVTDLKETVVKSAKLTNTENAVVSEIKNSSTVVSGISSTQISKTQDRNAADVVKRVPGVSIQDDRFIVVRGLADRYNDVWLNDAGTPSSETDKKSFSFDLIPSGLIDRILIYKTPSPELPGDFAGGMVKIYTTSITDKNQISVGVQTSSREYTTGTILNYENHSKTDWLGYDDGKRNIPSGFPSSDILNTKNTYYKDNISKWSKSFGNDWIISSKTTPMDGRFNLAISDVVKWKKLKIGNTFGLSYSNTYANYKIKRQDGDSSGLDYKYSDLQSNNNVTAGILENIGVSIGNSKIEFKNLYNQIGKSSLTYRTNIRDSINLPGDPDIRAYKLEYESKATYSTQLTGAHKSKDDSRKYTWTLGYDDLFKNQPDMRKIKYTKQQSDSIYIAQV